ncbi:Type 1 glutamine amidotransferase-like domain-containing protein [Kribbella sp. NPDC023972]|uniref:Type 1 glutamine amidotransferase-like domain-containing protein n=1 Tax=Kribbella sp. NPDC023972 TaxID=3154795 RepID=UPI0033C49BD9
MKLYLSSFRLGDHPERLVALLPPAARVAVICNSIDTEDSAVRREKVTDEITWLTELGLNPHELDLRSCTGGALKAQLPECDGVWVRGGNAFVLRAALAVSGADKLLPELIRSEEIVYAGYSAGACVLAPSLRGLELCDDPKAVDGEVSWEGLGVLDHAIVPHLDSPGHPETDLVAEVADLYDRTGVRYLGMRDGQALVIDGDHRELV